MSINIYLGIFIFLIFAIILPTFLVFLLKNKPKILKTITIIFLILYLIALFIGTTFSLNFVYPNITLEPAFSDSWFSMNFIAFSTGKLNLLLNLIMFLPIGFAVFVLSKKHRFLKTVLYSLFLSIFIELMQFILPIDRNTEILDIILNTLSGTISGLYCLLLGKFNCFFNKNFKKNNESQI